jgi:eukaryotic-like serine/threonine-protein kinase
MTIPTFTNDSDRFEIGRQLGSGAMATVYEAWDRKLERKVALKFISLEQSIMHGGGYDKILAEARAAARLDHPNIASVYDVITVDGRPCLVMQFIDGTSLGALSGSPPLPFDELHRIAIAIARGLAAAHASGIVHRDIKPNNILLTRSGEVKIVDFGMARIIAEEALKTLKTSHIRGTPAYMSPEVLQSIRPDERADVFSTGIVYYEICTGRYPFKVDSYKALFDSIVHSELPPMHGVNPQIPDWFSSIVQRMTAKDPKERYRGGMELLAALEPRVPPASASVSSPAGGSSRPEAGGVHGWVSNAIATVRGWLGS